MRIMICAMGLALFAAAQAQPQYEVIDLTAKFGPFFRPKEINNNGVIAASFEGQACVVQNGVLTMLPQYKGHNWVPSEIADNGDVLGQSTLFTGVVHTLLYRNGTVIDIGIAGTSNFAAGQGLNNFGQISGGNGTNAFIWEDGKTTLLPSPSPAFSWGLNDAGTAVGRMSIPGGDSHAVRWVGGVFSDLGPSWASDSDALEVNNKEEIAGWAIALTAGYRAVLWRNGLPIDLGDLGGGSRARDLNNYSQVVGEAIGHGPTEGILWDNGTLYRLEDLVLGGTGFQLINFAYSINDNGQILTSGFTGSANPELLFNPVPEPSTFCGLAAACSVLGIITISRRKKTR